MKQIFKIVLVAFGIFILIGIFAPSDIDSSNPNSIDTNKQTKEQALNTPGLNQSARDGKFEFIVKNIQCGINSVGSSWSKEEAVGQFCKVSVKVTNIGNEAQYFFDSNQTLVDTQGRQFDSQSLMTNDTQMWMTNINPGLSIEGNIFFDVPLGVNVSHIILHDSVFSGGVRINAN
jgi:hypothetical protein